MSAFRTSITKDGPFFQKDPVKTFSENVMALMEAVAEAGEADVVGQLRSGEGSRAPLSYGGRVADHVHGRVRSVRGKRWTRWAAVSLLEPGASREDAIALNAAGASVESRVHAFRKTRGRISRARKANVAELMRGL